MHNQPSTATTRPLKNADRHEWERLYLAYHAFHGRSGVNAPSPSLRNEIWTRLLAPRYPAYGFVAEQEGRVRAFAHLVHHANVMDPIGAVYLQDLYSDVGSRGQGLGALLIEQVYEHAATLQVRRVYWHTKADNFAARRLYDRVASHDGVVVYQRTIPQM